LIRHEALKAVRQFRRAVRRVEDLFCLLDPGREYLVIEQQPRQGLHEPFGGPGGIGLTEAFDLRLLVVEVRAERHPPARTLLRPRVAPGCRDEAAEARPEPPEEQGKPQGAVPRSDGDKSPEDRHEGSGQKESGAESAIPHSSPLKQLVATDARLIAPKRTCVRPEIVDRVVVAKLVYEPALEVRKIGAIGMHIDPDHLTGAKRLVLAVVAERDVPPAGQVQQDREESLPVGFL